MIEQRWMPRCPDCQGYMLTVTPRDRPPIPNVPVEVGCGKCGLKMPQSKIVWVLHE